MSSISNSGFAELERWKSLFETFIDHLVRQKGLSLLTQKSYREDLNTFTLFLEELSRQGVGGIEPELITLKS